MNDPYLTEKEMRKIQKQLKDREFENLEEANAFLQTFMSDRSSPDPQPETPLAKAQELAYEAHAAEGDERQRLAREALAVDPDCSDAWLILAEEAEDLDSAIEIVTKAVAAGERALGPKVFEEDIGHFWGMVETRPYMRARWNLAEALWRADRFDEAIDHAQDLLRLNHSDNLGIRYWLVHWLLHRNRDEQAWTLINEHDGDPSAMMRYGEALALYRKYGDDARARSSLQAALTENSYVPLILTEMLQEVRFPEDPPFVTPGGLDEAEGYWNLAFDSWAESGHAIPWLLDTALAMNQPAGRRQKVGRNEPCLCGSGKKYKHCCL